MNNEPDIVAMKAEIFDLMVQQETLQQEYNQLEQIKQAKLKELRTALATPSAT